MSKVREVILTSSFGGKCIKQKVLKSRLPSRLEYKHIKLWYLRFTENSLLKNKERSTFQTRYCCTYDICVERIMKNKKVEGRLRFCTFRNVVIGHARFLFLFSAPCFRQWASNIHNKVEVLKIIRFLTRTENYQVTSSERNGPTIRCMRLYISVHPSTPLDGRLPSSSISMKILPIYFAR